MAVVNPKCNLLKFISDYTTKYELDMPLDTSVKYLVNSVLYNTLSTPGDQIGPNAVQTVRNPCNINVACIVEDDKCDSSIFTLIPCTLQITGMSVVALDTDRTQFQITPTITGSVGAITYEWSFPHTGNPASDVMQLDSSSSLTNPTIIIDVIHDTLKQTILNVTLTVTDSTGCTSTKLCYFLLQDRNGAGQSLQMYCANTINCSAAEDFFVISSISNIMIQQAFYVGAETADVFVYAVGVAVPIFINYGGFTNTPFTITGVLPGSTYNVKVVKHCGDGTLTNKIINDILVA